MEARVTMKCTRERAGIIPLLDLVDSLDPFTLSHQLRSLGPKESRESIKMRLDKIAEIEKGFGLEGVVTEIQGYNALLSEDFTQVLETAEYLKREMLGNLIERLEACECDCEHAR